MAWLAVDKSGEEFIFEDKPARQYDMWVNHKCPSGDIIDLPVGSIEKLIGRPLTWEDEPVEI